jgi:glycosyl transferase family 25
MNDSLTLSQKINLISLFNESQNIQKRLSYPTFYINLDRDKSRRDYIEKQLIKLAPTFQRVKGINGYDIKNEKIKYTNKYNLSPGELGCTLSHLRAIKKAYKLGLDIAMICEDDISFVTNNLIEDLADIVFSAPVNWNILQLTTTPENFDDIKKFHDIYEYTDKSIIVPRKNYHSTVCYLINRIGMEKILSSVYRNGIYHIEPIYRSYPSYPSSGVSDFFIYELCNTYTIFPSLFIPNNEILPSTIHDDLTKFHIDTMNKVIDVYYKKAKNKLRIN